MTTFSDRYLKKYADVSLAAERKRHATVLSKAKKDLTLIDREIKRRALRKKNNRTVKVGALESLVDKWRKVVSNYEVKRMREFPADPMGGSDSGSKIYDLVIKELSDLLTELLKACK